MVRCIALQFRFEFLILPAAAAFTVKEDADCESDGAWMQSVSGMDKYVVCNLPMMLRVMAAASAPLLMIVGWGRVRRGGSLSPTGTPVTFVGGGGNTETVADADRVGRAILLEKISDDEVSVAEEDAVDAGDFGDFGELGESGESGAASDPVDVGRIEVTTVVLVWSVGRGRGATAAMPWVVGAIVKGCEEVDVEVLVAT